MDLLPNKKQSEQFQKSLLKWYKKNKRSFPWRKTKDPWSILIAEVLLRQTVAYRVSPIYVDFINRWPTPSSYLLARTSSVRSLIATLGLPYRASELKTVAKDICNRFQGKLPNSKEELLSIKGIGEYTASALLVFAYGKREAIVDTNIVRLLKRIFGISVPLLNLRPSKNLKELAQWLLPRKCFRSFNYALLDFTALVCTHYNPDCSNCIIVSLCKSPENLYLTKKTY